MQSCNVCLCLQSSERNSHCIAFSYIAYISSNKQSALSTQGQPAMLVDISQSTRKTDSRQQQKVCRQTSVDKNNVKTTKRGKCECIATWRLPDVALVVLGCFWPNLYCTCTQSAISSFQSKFWHRHYTFSDPSFLKESNLAITRRFHTVTLTYDIWPWTYVICWVSRDQSL